MLISSVSSKQVRKLHHCTTPVEVLNGKKRVFVLVLVLVQTLQNNNRRQQQNNKNSISDDNNNTTNK
jgi:ribose 5-phosphate isomerase